ncbi:uncharacterized protein [Rutidosis leptorrhynchoides]|uniref:uncharacterized protein n=1 Tax=Rutidosis leptorrhynchoides TaxID=125765 RepID=UPI003A9938D5
MTDQDLSMLIAVQSVFLTARHRLCMWHITDWVQSAIRLGPICMQIGSNLQSVGHAISRAGFKFDISNIVWTDKLDPDEFDRRWFSILHKYNLDDHNWLIDMFDLRQKWIPAYFRDLDMSGLMRTSSRSESENHVFQQLMSRSSTLVEFISFFETAMEIQRYEQSKNDHESLYTTPEIETQHPMEKHAGKVFTRAAFFMIQGQMKAATRYCMSYKIQKLSEDTTKFCIGDTSVKTSNIDETIDRIANPYYFDESIQRFSDVIVNRRTKENFATAKCMRELVIFAVTFYMFLEWRLCPKQYFHPSISRDVDQCVHLNKRDPEKMKVYRDLIKDLKDKVFSESGETSMMGSNNDLIPALVGLPQPDNISVHAPQGIRNKVCGNRRIINARQEAINKKGPAFHKSCKHCGKSQHNVRSCPDLKEQVIREKQIAEKNAKRAADIGNKQGSVSRSGIDLSNDIHGPPSELPRQRTAEEVIKRANSRVNTNCTSDEGFNGAHSKNFAIGGSSHGQYRFL